MKYIEILFCLLEVAVQFSALVEQNFIRYRTCVVTLGFNETECALLGTSYHDNKTEALEKTTQPHVTVLNTTKDLTDAFLSAFMCLFLGPWSDKFGRRPVLLAAFAGYTLSYAISTIVVSIPSLSPWYMLLNIIPLCVVGGFPILLSSTICYIVDTTAQENKGFRLGVFEVCLTIAALIGTTLSPYGFKAWGYSVVLLVTTSCLFVAFILMTLKFPESIPNPQPLKDCAVKDLFKFSLVKETVRATFKKRNNGDRKFLLIVISIIIIYFLAVTADDKIVFLYLSTKIHWSLKDYAFYLTVRKILFVAGSFIGAFILHKLLRIREGYMILLGMFSMMMSALLQGIGYKYWHIYVAGGSRLFGGVISPMTRALVSKITAIDDAGKVFSFVVICQTLIAFVGRPIYTYLYNNTLETIPGAFNFVTVGIYVVEMVLTIPVIVMQRSWQQADIAYENLNSDNSPEEEEDNISIMSAISTAVISPGI